VGASNEAMCTLDSRAGARLAAAGGFAMRALLIGLLVAGLAGAAHAEDQTRTITFRHAAAAEVARMMDSGSLSQNGAPLEALSRVRAWSVDVERNELVLIGEPDAMLELERVARLLDVAPSTVRLQIERVAVLPADLQRAVRTGRLGLREDGGFASLAALTLSDEQRASITPSEPIVLTTSDRTAVRVRAGANAPRDRLHLTPRVNGDRSVTLAGVVTGSLRLPPGEGIGSDTLVRLQKPGESVLLAMLDGRDRWLVTLLAVTPPDGQ